MKILAMSFLLFFELLSVRSYAEKIEEIELWKHRAIPNTTPSIPVKEIQSKKVSVSQIITPRLQVYLPEAKNNHIAVLIISGGGYAQEELGHESTPTANYFQSKGFTAFELIYRLPKEGWSSPLVPFQDGQRAIRLIRSKSQYYQYESDRVGVLGFSAGAHLAGILSTNWEKNYYPILDKIDSLSARPDFAVLLYPIITIKPPLNHTQSYKNLFGKHATKFAQQALSVQDLVTSTTPPVFLAQSKNDPISPVANSLLMHNALNEKQIPNKLVLFDNGGHGWGLGKPKTETIYWPDLFLKWLADNTIR